MTDQRLDAGRHHLREGEFCLQKRDYEASRGFFESAILQFAGPDLKMGEGHALRGLASVALAGGDPTRCESLLNAAIGCFRAVRTLLDALDDAGLAAAHRVDAMEAEACTQVQLGEFLLRSGRVNEAIEARNWARAAYDGVGNRSSEAGLWALTGHIASRQGTLDEALLAYEQSLRIHERSGDLRGQESALQSIAEIHRLSKDFSAAELYLKQALALARKLGDPSFQARTLSGMGLLARHRNEVDAAILAYEEAMRLAVRANDQEMQGFAQLNLGDIRSRGHRGQPLKHFRQAVEHFGAVGGQHALGATMLRASEHALRTGNEELALALAVGARRIWQTMDPVRGVGQTLRVIVKALARDADAEGLLLVACLREDLVGAVQPHAGKVADYYRERVSAADLVHIEAMAVEDRRVLGEEYINEALTPSLSEFGLSYSDLGTTRSALILLDLLAAAPDARDLSELTAADLEELPDEDAYYTLSESDILPSVETA